MIGLGKVVFNALRWAFMIMLVLRVP